MKRIFNLTILAMLSIVSWEACSAGARAVQHEPLYSLELDKAGQRFILDYDMTLEDCAKAALQVRHPGVEVLCVPQR